MEYVLGTDPSCDPCQAFYGVSKTLQWWQIMDNTEESAAAGGRQRVEFSAEKQKGWTVSVCQDHMKLELLWAARRRMT